MTYWRKGILAAAAVAGLAQFPAPGDAGRNDEMKSDFHFLRTQGTDIVDRNGRPLVLKGVNLGAWMVYERWIFNVWDDSWPADEMGFWRNFTGRFGRTRARKLKAAYRDNVITDRDFALIAGLGFNCVRLPFWYWDLEPEPGRYDAAGFRLLDRAIKAAARHGLYTILDLHGAPGGQSAEDHTGWQGRNFLWQDPEAQAWTIGLWEKLARRYREKPEVAGYDLLNEPMGASSLREIMDFSDRIYRAIRKHDSRHTIFIEDGYKGHEGFPEPARMNWENVVYSVHYYPFDCRTKKKQEDFMQLFGRIRKEQLRLNVPIFIGEFSAVETGCGGLEIYDRFLSKHDEYGWSWTLWTWKRFVHEPSECIWGVLNQPKSGRWRSFDPGKDSFKDLLRGMESLNSDNWEIAPEMEKMLRAHLPQPAGR